MRKTCEILSLLLLCAWGVAAYSQSSGSAADALKSCYTDPMVTRLREAYPQGVPGRNLPKSYPQAKVDADLSYYIPVVVHVMHAYGPEQDVTPDQIESQIRIMNEGFGRYGAGFNDNPVAASQASSFASHNATLTAIPPWDMNMCPQFSRSL